MTKLYLVSINHYDYRNHLLGGIFFALYIYIIDAEIELILAANVEECKQSGSLQKRCKNEHFVGSSICTSKTPMTLTCPR